MERREKKSKPGPPAHSSREKTKGCATRLMQWPTLKCPFCGGILPNREVRFRQPLTCPVCSRQLKFSRRYLRLVRWTSVAITFAVCFLIGFRGWELVVAAIVSWLPVDLVWTYPFNRIVPPPLEAYVSNNPEASKKPTDSGPHSSSLDMFHR